MRGSRICAVLPWPRGPADAHIQHLGRQL